MSYATRDHLDERGRELWDQGGAVAAIVNLAQTIRHCATEVAGAVEGVAIELDKERRGAMAAGHRQDMIAITQTIEKLLQGELLRDDEREELRGRVLEMLDPKEAL